MRSQVLLLSVLFLMSCSDLSKKNQIERIDALQVSVDSIEVVSIENQIHDIEVLQNHIDEVQEILAECNDTVSLDFALLIDEYKSTSEALIEYRDLNKIIDTNVVLIQSSLNKLKEDITDANGKRNEYDNYIEHESVKLDSLRVRLSRLVFVKTSILEGDAQYYPTLINELNASSMEEGMNIDE